MSDSNIYLDGTGNFNALTKNAGTIKYGTFNNAASNTGVIAVSAIFTGTAVNSGVIGNILPINTANLVASNSAAWESTYNTVADLSANWGGGGGGGAADLTAIVDVSATWDAAYTYVVGASADIVFTSDARLSDARTPAAHTQAISTIDGLQIALDAKQASGDFATNATIDVLSAAIDSKQVSGSYATTSITTALSTAIDSKQASGSYAAASHTHTSSDVVGFADDVAALIDTAAGDSIASLVNGKVPSIQLPSYVDDVEEAADVASFPNTGETGKIYVATSTNKTYRWSGSGYVEISPSPGSTDSVVEGTANLYFTNARVDSRLQSTSLYSNSANWNSTYTVVGSNSATWSAASSTPTFSSLTTSAMTLSSAMLSTFSTPVTASGDFVVVTVGDKKRLIRLWDNT